MTQHPEEGALHAYIDGELPPAEAAALEAHVAACASCAAALAEARGLVAGASRAISALDVAPSSARPATRPAASAPARPKARPIFRVPYARAAALLLLVGGTAVVLDRSGTLEREGAPRAELLTADEGTTTQVAPAAAPVPTVAATTPSVPAPSAERGAAAGRDGRAAGAATRKVAAATGAAAGVAADAAASNRRTESAATAPAPAPLPESQGVSFAASRRRIVLPGDTTRPSSVAAVVPAAPPPARAAETSLSDLVVTGASSSPVRVTRYRTKEGAVLTLTDEPLRASFAEEAAGARRAAAQNPPRRAVPQAAQAGAAAPVLNSYRWTGAEGRVYTLTGALSIAELEALSKRLAELEKLP